MHHSWARLAVRAGTFAIVAALPAAAIAGPIRSHERHEDARRGGVTVVTLNQTTIDAVVNTLGLTPGAVAPGTLGQNGSALEATFPIVGRSDRGIIRHRGGLSLTNGSTTLTLTRYVIDTGKGILTAKARVNGKLVGRIPLFDLGAAAPQAGALATASLSLDAAAADALVAIFALPVQGSDITGLDFGTAAVLPPVPPATSVTLNQATIDAVVGLGLSPAAVAPGTLGAQGSDLVAAFPIVGEIEHGMIRHRGGLSLTSGSTVLTLTDFVIDTGRGVLTAKARVNGTWVGRIRLFDLGAAAPQSGALATASLSLDAAAAAALVAVFHLPVAASDITGLDFGVAVVPASAQRDDD